MSKRTCPKCDSMLRQDGATPVTSDWTCVICGFWGRLDIETQTWKIIRQKPVRRITRLTK